MLGGLVVGIVVGGQTLLGLINPSSRDYTGQGSGEVEVRVQDGDTLSDIARTLVEGRRHRLGRPVRRRRRGPPRTRSGIQPGVYGLREQMSGQAALDLLLDPVARLVSRVTLPEGLTVEATLARLAEKHRHAGRGAEGRAPPTPRRSACRPTPTVRWRASSSRPPTTSSPTPRRPRSCGRWWPAGCRRSTSCRSPSRTACRVLTEASIVQAEAGSVEDMGKVARVLDNRLADDMPLQLDTTVNYANGKRGITTTPQDRQNPSPYNTYLHPGLPPGPISNPGEEALRAVLKPTPGDWLLLRRRRPRHRRDPVRRDRSRSTSRTCSCSSSGCGTHPERMSRAAVLGRPVAHSLSPLLHRAAYAALGLTDWTYDALDIGAEDLPVLLAGLGEEWRGFSVTMPCKQAAVDVADVVEPLPRLLHAANTLVRTDAGLASREHRRRRHRHGAAAGRRGAGRRGDDRRCRGTAAAAAVALSSLGAEHVDVVVRDPARAADVGRVLDVLGVPFTVTPLAGGRARRPARGQHRARSPRSPTCCSCPGAAGHTVLDVLYAPWPTPLAQRVDRGRRHGRRRPGRAVLAGHRPGGADDRAARADRRDAQRARRRRRRPLTAPWRPCSLVAALLVRGRAGAVARPSSPPGWPPATTPRGPGRCGRSS